MKKKNLYMIFLFILSFILLINSNVSAKTYKNYTLGDEVYLSKGTDVTSSWLVIEDKNSELVLLKKNPITSEKSKYSRLNVSDYDTSDIKVSVDTYGASLNLGSNLKSISLVDEDIASKIGCDINRGRCNNSKFFGYVYWTKIIKNDHDVYLIYPNSAINSFSSSSTAYIIPVIVVSKDAVLNGYTNDTKTFEDINIECTSNLKSKDDFKCKFKIDKTVKKIAFDFEIESNGIIENYRVDTSNWNNSFPTAQENNNMYKYENIQLNNKIDLNNDILFELIGKIKKITQDSSIKLKLTNIKMYDELGDYQNIDSIEKEIKVQKEQVNTETKEEIKNPKTGISSKIGIFMIIIGLGIIAYLTVQRYSKNY